MEPSTLPSAAFSAADAIVQLLLRQENLYLMVAVYGFLATVRKVLPPNVGDHHVAVRLAPLYPLVLCSAGVWIPGQQPPDMAWGSKLLVGIILGWACGHLHKVWKQTVRGEDSRIKARRVAKGGGAGPDTSPPGSASPPAA